MAQTLQAGNAVTPSASYVEVPIALEAYKLQPERYPLLTLIGSMQSMPTMANAAPGCCGGPTYKYNEYQFLPTITSLNGDILIGATTIVLADAIARAGDQIILGNEVILLGTTSDNLTFASCTRSVGTGAAAAGSSGAKVKVVAKSNLQGAALDDTSFRVQPNVITGYTRIGKAGVGVSRTYKHSQVLGDGGDQLREDAMNKTVDLIAGLEHQVVYGVGAAPTTSVAGSFDGIYERVIGVNATDASSGDITLALIKDAVGEIDEYHGNDSVPLALIVGNHQRYEIDAIGWGKVQLSPTLSAMYGAQVQSVFVSGREMALITDHNMDTNGLAMIVTPSAIGVGPLTPEDHYTYVEKGKTNDGDEGNVIGEYGCAVQGTKTHHIFYAVATS